LIIAIFAFHGHLFLPQYLFFLKKFLLNPEKPYGSLTLAIINTLPVSSNNLKQNSTALPAKSDAVYFLRKAL